MNKNFLKNNINNSPSVRDLRTRRIVTASSSSAVTLSASSNSSSSINVSATSSSTSNTSVSATSTSSVNVSATATASTGNEGDSFACANS